MKLRFILDRLDELPLFILSIAMSVWTSIPYTPESLRQVVERQSLSATHCYFTTDGDHIEKQIILIGSKTVADENYARGACATFTFFRGDLHVLSSTTTNMVVELNDPQVDVVYGKAIVLTNDGTLPLDRRIQLSTKLRSDLRATCAAEIRKVVPERVSALIHNLSRDVKVTVKLSSANWCETGPVV